MGQRDQAKAEKAAEKAEAKAKQAQAEANKAQEEAKTAESLKDAQDRVNNFLTALRNAAKDAVNSMIEKNAEAPKEIEKIDVESASQDPSTPGYTGYDVDTDTITYTYKPGDTFGQVLADLGLKSDKGLWGADGDVAYYTQQLVDQGALDSRGNIPIGTTIKLRRRGAPEIKMSTSETIIPGKMVQDAKYPERQQINRSGARLN